MRLQIIFYSIIFLFITSQNCYAQNKKQEHIATSIIRKTLDTQTQAWNEGNLENFMAGYWQSDSLKFIGKSGITYGWLPTLNNYKKSYPDKAAMGILTFDILSIEITSNTTAFVIGKWKLQRQNDEPKGYFTLFWRKIKGKWLIVADHSS
jgi:Domain of unknown function (DUF4440)